jgi:hypothetical protein
MTNNPRKIAGLSQLGFEVKREPIEIAAAFADFSAGGDESVFSICRGNSTEIADATSDALLPTFRSTASEDLKSAVMPAVWAS